MKTLTAESQPEAKYYRQTGTISTRIPHDDRDRAVQTAQELGFKSQSEWLRSLIYQALDNKQTTYPT